MPGPPCFSKMPAEILSTHTPQLFAEAVRAAADRLRSGQVVAIPTETVYGLAANAMNPQAVAEIFSIKGRPAHNPIIVHVVGLEMARQLVAAWPEAAQRCAEEFWPGPLTLVVPSSPRVPAIVTAGGQTVGLRWPSHPFAQALIRECDFPLAAPSANCSEQVSPTCAEHVRQSLGDAIPLIIDGGQCQIGIESTVLDLSNRECRILRPGMIGEEPIRRLLADASSGLENSGSFIARSPGQLPRHYSPRARLLVWRWRDDAELRAQLRREGIDESSTHVLAHAQIPKPQDSLQQISVIPSDAEAFARALYSEFRRCDDAGAKTIVIESPPEGSEWIAIHDRLRRAMGEG